MKSRQRKIFVEELVSEKRRVKNQFMQEFGIKSGKTLRRIIKKVKREKKEVA